MKEIWVLTTDWAHDGEIGDNAELYEKEETARKKFQQVVKEIKSNYSHVDFNAPDCDYCIVSFIFELNCMLDVLEK